MVGIAVIADLCHFLAVARERIRGAVWYVARLDAYTVARCCVFARLRNKRRRTKACKQLSEQLQTCLVPCALFPSLRKHLRRTRARGGAVATSARRGHFALLDRFQICEGKVAPLDSKLREPS